MGLPSTLNEGTHKSQPLPKGPTTHPKDAVGNIQPLDMDLTSMTSDEGTTKTTPRPKGSLGDKDSEGNIPPADMEPIHTTVVDPSGTGAKYQVDEIQSTRLRFQPLTKNEGKTSSKVELDTEPLGNIQPLDRDLTSTTSDEGIAKTMPHPKGSLGDKDLGGNIPPVDMQPMHTTVADLSGTVSEDELDKESHEEEVLAIREDMDEDPQVAEVVRTPSPKQDQPEPSHEQHEEEAVSYADLKASIEEYYDENVAHKDQTNKMVESTMNTIEKSNDPATSKKLDEAIKTFTKISTNTTEVLSLVKDFDFSTLQSTMKDLQAHALKHAEVLAAWTKSSTNMAWNLAPSSCVTPTLALTNILKNVEGENETNTATKEPPSHTEGEIEDIKMAILISSIQHIEVPPTQAQPITTITTHPESPQAAPRIDKGKGITTESDEDPSKKLVPATTIIHPDPDEEVKVPYMINGKMCYLTNIEMQAYLDKEEKLRKAIEEARLLAISKPEVIKVVQEESKEIGLDPKKIATAKAGDKFKKAQVAKHEVLKRQHTRRYERIRKIPEELGIKSAQPAPTHAPEQASSKSSRRKRKHMELDPEIKSSWVGVESLVSYLVIALMVKTEENARFSLKLRKLIADHPDQENLKSKRVNL
ncbi:hypothetical protein Tco_0886235 [Tanacetum coccineum]